MNLPDGYRFQHGKYQTSHVIGQGGFGITYKGVWHTEVKGPLGAIKTAVPICIKEYFFKDYCYRDADGVRVNVHSETGRLLFQKFREKLIKEAKILSDVHHPHIVNVLEVFEENNTAYIAMEYIDGYSLKSKLEKKGMLPESEVLAYIRQIGEALQFVHANHILHLDVKPGNILIDARGNARLIDFGVSRRFEVGREDTSTTILTLSKGFAAIEQYDDEGIPEFSPCPDIYSLGATCYNLLTGKIPTESILRATRPLIPPTEWNKSIRPETEAVILKAMEVTPETRYQSMEEMLSAFDFSVAELPVVEQLVNTPQISTEEETLLLQTPADEKTKADTSLDEDVTIYAPANNENLPLMESASFITKFIKRPLLWLFILLPVMGILLLGIYFIRQWNAIEEMAPVILSATNEEVDVEDVAGIPPALSTDIKEELQAEKGKAVTTEVVETAAVAALSGNETLKENIEEVLETTNATKEATIHEEYEALLKAGKSALESNSFEDARRDFIQAKELQLTEEVVRLLIACDEKEAKHLLVEKKKEYEEKRSFGKFMIVRKKSNGRYGAIDDHLKEIIPCHYLNVGISDHGRAFEREDGLFDIYNNEGKLINKGATYY